tara:strand:- start:413 stop:1141 length:729 start_codon:yes stop_codon:yes gene_type:complete
MKKTNKELPHLCNTLAIVALAWAFNANAIPVVTNGTWISLEEDNGPVANISGIGTNKVSWGNPFGTSTAGPSGYTFAGVNGDAPLNNTLFALGDFTHDNFTISLPSISGANLDVNLNFTDEGVSQDFSFNFVHIETPNNTNPCAEGGAIPCPDLVLIPDTSSSETVLLQGNQYLLSILGFSQDGGTTVVPSFLTAEGQPNTATLYARLVLVPPTNDVSEPSALMLLAIGLVGLWSSSRRKIR